MYQYTYRLGHPHGEQHEDDDAFNDDDAVEASHRLRASSLDVFGAFITSSPRQIETCVDGIIETCMENLKFDPNFNEMDDETESKLADQMDVDDPFGDDPLVTLIHALIDFINHAER